MPIPIDPATAAATIRLATTVIDGIMDWVAAAGPDEISPEQLADIKDAAGISDQSWDDRLSRARGN